MPHVRYFIALEEDIDKAHDGGLFSRRKEAERLCGNLIVNTGEPWKVFECIVHLPSEGQDSDPDLDGTDAAHPAWWRGQQHGFDAAMQMIEQALVERPVGVISSERWQALRERIHAMASRSRDD